MSLALALTIHNKQLLYNPSLAHDFTFNMFSVQGIEILGTPIDTDIYIKEYVQHNCLKIITDTVKHDPLTDGFVDFHLTKFCVNTRTQYMSANITLPLQEHFLSAQHVHVDTAIADAILRKGTRGSFRQWDKNDYDLAVTRLQMPNADGDFGLTPNTIAQTSAKVAMASRFLGLVGSLLLDEQKLWLPNQLVHDPDTWTTPHLFHLKREYVTLVDKYGCVVQETFTVQDPPVSPSDTLLLPPLKCLYTDNERIQERPQPGDSRPVIPPSNHTLSRQIMRKWEPWTTNIAKSNNHRMLQQLAFINGR